MIKKLYTKEQLDDDDMDPEDSIGKERVRLSSETNLLEADNIDEDPHISRAEL